MRFTRFTLWLGLALAALWVAAPVPANAQTGGITGVAKLQDGSLCVGCPVIIERQEIKGTYKTKTDKHGKYIYIGLPIGNYKITLENPSGQVLFFFNGKHIGLGDPTEADFDLAKETAAAKQQQAANPEYQQKLQQEQKEQKEFQGLKSLYDGGMQDMEQKNYADAVTKFEQALPLAKGKNQVAVEEQLADAYHKTRQYDKSLETYQKVLALDPNNAGVHNNLGNLYADMNKTEEAKAEFQKAAEIDPAGASKYYFNLGAIMYNQGKMDDSAEAFKKAISLDPKYADAYFWLGQALMGKATTGADGKVVAVPGTIEAFQKYLELSPNGSNAPAAQALIQTIQGGVQTEFSKKKKKG